MDALVLPYFCKITSIWTIEKRPWCGHWRENIEIVIIISTQSVKTEASPEWVAQVEVDQYFHNGGDKIYVDQQNKTNKSGNMISKSPVICTFNVGT